MVIKKIKEVNMRLYRWVVIPKRFGFKRGVGRNNLGRITSFHLGGGHKRLFRIMDYSFVGISRCIGVYYDPNRSSFLALIQPLVIINSKDSVLFWVLAPKGISVNMPFNTISFFYKLRLDLIGIFLFFVRKELRYFVLQQEVHNISVKSGGKVGMLVRSAGCSAVLRSFLSGGLIVCLLLPSGKFCFIIDNCVGTTGRVSNRKHYLKKLYKAGQSRWLGRRSIVRGIAMNPVDHPHGGRTGGGRPSVSPWGKLTKAQGKKKVCCVLEILD